MTDLTRGDTQLIIDLARSHGLLRNQLAYVLATAYWESGKSMKPVAEAYYLQPKYHWTDKQMDEWRKKNLRYYPWYGRGYVQITWEKNYIRLGKRLDLDLTSDPDVVMQPAVAAKIIVVGMKEGLFTGKKLADYITLQKSDFVTARKIVNGLDRAADIAEFAKKYDAALKEAGYGESEAIDHILEDHGKPMTISSTTVATGLGTVAAATATAKEIAENVNSLWSMAPWLVVAVIVAGAGAWVVRERWRKALDARAVSQIIKESKP